MSQSVYLRIACVHIVGMERVNLMNTKSKSDSYAAAGVDITAGYKAVELMKKHIARTVTQQKSEDIGGFGGLFELDLTGITSLYWLVVLMVSAQSSSLLSLWTSTIPLVLTA